MATLKIKRRMLLIGVGLEVVILMCLGVFLIKTLMEKNNVAAELDKNETLLQVDVKGLIKTTYKYMLRRIRDNGTYDYQVDLDTGEMAKDYNIMRHSGASWGLLEAYEDYGESGEELVKIKTTLDFVINNKLKYKDAETAYITDSEEWHGRNRVAENALVILGLIKYNDIENDESYLRIAKALANGLIAMQTEAGQYFHEMNDEFTGIKLEAGKLYDGEINLALIRIYKKTGEEKYLAAVEKSLQYLAGDKYLMKDDQWMSYLYLELLDVTDKYKLDFLANLEKNVKLIDRNIKLCDMEYLGNAYRYVTRLMENGEELGELLEEIKGVYYRRARKGLEKLATSENGIGGKEYEGAFLIDEHVARIDASQHNLSGYRMFYDYFYKTERPEDLARYADVMIKERENENQYVNLARRAVETYVRTGKKIKVPEGLDGELTSAVSGKPEKMAGGLYGGGRGVYVTIRNNGNLRGCRGSYYATEQTLAEEIIKQAITSATEDKRVEPVKIDELDDLVYEVSILDEPVKVNDKSELNPEIYGIMIVQNEKNRALMLPGLATIKSVDEQIAKTLKKGEVGENEEYEIWRFMATKHK